MEDYNEEGSIIQNLEDAGCCPEVIECFLKCLEQGKTRDGCLDYLVYQLEKHRNYSCTSLGYLEDPVGLKEALGSGNVQAAFQTE